MALVRKCSRAIYSLESLYHISSLFAYFLDFPNNMYNMIILKSLFISTYNKLQLNFVTLYAHIFYSDFFKLFKLETEGDNDVNFPIYGNDEVFLWLTRE